METARLGLRYPKLPLITLLSLAAIAALPLEARAAFPGADGLIAYDTGGPMPDIHTVKSDGTGDTALTATAADSKPAWSPDGTKIAFVSARTGNDEIFVMNADGSGETRVTDNNPASDTEPAWSGDGTQIVFSSNRAGNFEIYKMNAAPGAALTRLTSNSTTDSAPAWTSDSSKIAFQSDRSGNVEIYKMNADGTSPTRLTTNGALDYEPNWSPNGARITYASDLQGNWDIWTMNADGSGKAVRYGGTGTEDEPAYSPSTPDYYYYGRTAYADTTQITVSGSPIATGRSPDWQPVVSTPARPKSASPIQISFVPAYRACSSSQANTIHQGGISSAACNPPSAESPYLTVGTPGANGNAANSVGYVKLKAVCEGGAPNESPPCSITPGDQEDGSLAVSYTDVRCATPTTSPWCVGDDYVGDLQFKTTVRITDGYSAGAGYATVTDLPLETSVGCDATPLSSIGSTCSVTTAFDAIVGGNAIAEQERAIWHVADVTLEDGGYDGVGSTSGNSLFAHAGLFFP